jgi:RNA polymerase sigma-70 factor (ECF subfamily)
MTGRSRHVQGAEAVAGQARMWARANFAALEVRRALINGAAGLVSLRHGKPFSVGAFTITEGRIVECDFLVDPDRLAGLDLTVLHG